jgi:O-acetyl-ADP-ribose deacetylase (regulator of RNase III)
MFAISLLNSAIPSIKMAPSIEARMVYLQKKIEEATTMTGRRKAQNHLDLFLKTMPKVIERSHNDVTTFIGPIAHCISTDLAMYAGVAKAICESRPHNKPPGWGIRGRRLFQDEATMGTLLICRDGEGNEKTVINMITSISCRAPSSWTAMKKCIERLREMVEREKIYRLAIPRLGSGRDGLPWEHTRKYLLETFKGCPVAIEIFFLKDNVAGH